jgi:hypothetical protein
MTKLVGKNSKRDHIDAEDFTPPYLEMSSSSSIAIAASKEIYVGRELQKDEKADKGASDKIAGKKSKPHKASSSPDRYPMHRS